jgi:PncC family amidohydrolase
MSQIPENLAQILVEKNVKLILTESCTAGAACAALGHVPGISKNLCGSFVVYRPSQKQNILNVPASLIEEVTPESKEVVDWLAKEALTLTPEASWSGAIVGHLGPNAPKDKDGVIWISIYGRNDQRELRYRHERKKLNSLNRSERIREASFILLEAIRETIESN